MNSLADVKQPLNIWSQSLRECSEPTQSGSKEIPDTATRFRDDGIIMDAESFRDDEIAAAALLRDGRPYFVVPAKAGIS